MNIDELLDVMDETLEEAVNLPFTGGKRMVDVEKVRDIIDDIRLNMPAEIRQAKAIVQDRADIVESAKKEAEAIVKRAETAPRHGGPGGHRKGRPAEGYRDSDQRPEPEPRDAHHGYQLLRNMLRHTEEQLPRV
ncbi:MAG: ATPase [Ruthenibacterium lactatiformans]